MKSISLHPHRRFNILNGRWLQISPHRTQRPWQGKQDRSSVNEKPAYDPGCYLCPGNERAGGIRNESYTGTFVFDNDFSALKPDTPAGSLNTGDLLVAKLERGTCRVICFSPDHNLTLPEMELEDIRKVVDVWTQQYEELGSRPYINYVQIFENKGEIMGCSNPHPHGQIWAQETIPEEPAGELRQQEIWYREKNQTLLNDYLNLELELGDRIVAENESFVALVPFWAFWPFETMLVSRRPFGRFGEMTETEKDSLASMVKLITTRYDNIFNVSFPYSAGFHPAPTDGRPHPEWHFHMHFYPPLLRSATVQKFRVGYEMLGTEQRDITAEYTANLLRELPDIHYNQREV